MIGQYLMLLSEEVIHSIWPGPRHKNGNFDPIKFVSTPLTGHMADRLSSGV